MKICDFTLPELTLFREQCNFTDLERKCFDLKAKDYSNIQLAMQLNVSESTITVTMRRVRTKILKVLNWEV